MIDIMIDNNIKKPTWKFLLLGITGDLSKKKILPGLAQFAMDYKDEIDVELYGYSRSVPDEKEMENILNTVVNQPHNISHLKMVQGDYADNDFFHEIIQGLESHQRLVVYLAVPPSVFVQFLQNSCPYSSRPIDILIEKPFGTSLKEAEKILSIVQACDLGRKVHFCDHYLFKNGTFLPDLIKKEMELLSSKKIKSITVKVLESVGVEGRAGYYDNTGALQDMLPHLYSLNQLVLDEIYGKNENNENTIFAEKTEILEYKSGQYNSYLSDLFLTESQTESYFFVKFKTNFNTKLLGDNPIEITYESGKKLGLKKTSVEIGFENGEKFEWEIQPDAKVNINQTVYDILDNNTLDHNKTLSLLLTKDYSRFVLSKNMLANWKLYENIIDFKLNDKNQRLAIYKQDNYPIF